MSQYAIAILDTDGKRTDFLKNLFMRDEYDVRLSDSLPALISYIQASVINAILVDYQSLVSEERQTVVTFFKRYAISNIFVYNLPVNANKRLAFYELGARRVFDVNQPLDEIYYALAWPLKNIRGDLDKDKLYSSGNLEEVSLKILLNTLAREERTGILTVVTDNNSGKIYFNNGFLSHAQVGLHTGEKALLHMLFWHQGRFSFNASTLPLSRNSVTLSSIAILILAEKIRRQYVEDVKTVGTLDSMLQARYVGDLMQSDIELKTDFQKLIEHPQRLSRVLENHFYCNFETAAKLAELMRRGFLEVRHPDSVQQLDVEDTRMPAAKKDIEVSSFFSKDEGELIVKKLNLFPGSEGGLFLLSTTGVASCNMLKTLSGSTPDSSDNSAIYQGTVVLKKDIALQIYSLALNEFVLDDLSQNIEAVNGLVFLVDAGVEEQFEYEKYIIRQIITNYNVPWNMAFIHGSESTDWTGLKTFFDLSEELEPTNVIPENNKDIKELLLRMDQYPLKVYKVKTGPEEKST